MLPEVNRVPIIMFYNVLSNFLLRKFFLVADGTDAYADLLDVSEHFVGLLVLGNDPSSV